MTEAPTTHTALPNDGATPPVASEAEQDPCWVKSTDITGALTDRKTNHSWAWKWVNGVWTDTVYCTTCLKEKESERAHG